MISDVRGVDGVDSGPRADGMPAQALSGTQRAERGENKVGGEEYNPISPCPWVELMVLLLLQTDEPCLGLSSEPARVDGRPRTRHKGPALNMEEVGRENSAYMGAQQGRLLYWCCNLQLTPRQVRDADRHGAETPPVGQPCDIWTRAR